MTTRIQERPPAPCGTPRCAARPARPAASSGRWPGCCATRCSRCPPLLAVLAVRAWGGAVGGLRRWPGWWRRWLVWWRAHPRLLRPVGRPLAPLGLAALDRLPRPPLAGLLDDVRAHPRPPPHRPDARAPGCCGSASVTPSIDTLRRADGPRAGPADLDRPHRPPSPTPCMRAPGRGHPPPPRRARPWSWSGACPFTARPPRHPPSPTRRPRWTWPRLDVGDNEYGGPFLLNLRGKRLLVAGASGAGKSGAVVEPAARGRADDPRRPASGCWMIDLKGGTETERGRALFHRWATTAATTPSTLLTDFRDPMLARQAVDARRRRSARCDDHRGDAVRAADDRRAGHAHRLRRPLRRPRSPAAARRDPDPGPGRRSR